MELTDLSYLVVDVETTGGSPATGHRVTEIAAAMVDGGRVVRVFEQLVDPGRPIPPFITRLTGISDAMVRGAPPFAAIVPGLIELLAGSVFVAHNAAFDWRFVSAELERAVGRTPTARRLCTVRLARLLLPQLPRRSLDHVAGHYGVAGVATRYALRRTSRHSAAGDAVVTAHCLIRLLEDARTSGITTWDDVDRRIARRAPDWRHRAARAVLPATDTHGAVPPGSAE